MAVLSTGSTHLAHDTGLEGTNVRAMSIATTLFFMWGFLTCLNDILIPHLKAIFDLNYTMAMLVQFAFFSSYFIFALPSGKLVDWRGTPSEMPPLEGEVGAPAILRPLGSFPPARCRAAAFRLSAYSGADAPHGPGRHQ